jgi:hypothetical protein
MQEKGIVNAEGKYQIKILRTLVDSGIAMECGGAEGPLFTLKASWLSADLSRRPPRKVKLNPPPGSKRPPARPADSKQPEPVPQRAFERPATAYNNRTREQIINELLKD